MKNQFPMAVFQRMDDISKALAHCESLESISLQDPPDELAAVLAPIQEALRHYIGAFGDRLQITYTECFKVQFDYQAFADKKWQDAICVFLAGKKGYIPIPPAALTDPKQWIEQLLEQYKIEDAAARLEERLAELQQDYEKLTQEMYGE